MILPMINNYTVLKNVIFATILIIIDFFPFADLNYSLTRSQLSEKTFKNVIYSNVIQYFHNIFRVGIPNYF